MDASLNEKVKESIKNLRDKKSRIYFLVQDTKGNPKGGVRYIYQMAMVLKNEGYTKEELEFNNLLGLIDHAERRVFYNVRHSALYLKEYGLSAKDIKQLLIEKLGVKLDLDETDVKLLLGRD